MKTSPSSSSTTATSTNYEHHPQLHQYLKPLPYSCRQAVAWSQCTGGMTPVLSKREAIMSFGNHKFMLQELHEYKCLRVVLLIQNPKLVLDRLQSIVKKTVTSRGESYLLDMSTVCECVAGGGGLWLSDQFLNASLLSERFGTWLPPRSLLPHYDVFLSYRWGPFDSDVLEKLHDILSSAAVGAHGRRLDIFFDRVRLQMGRRFDHDFMRALCNSNGAVPIVSKDAIKRMIDIRSDSSEDHVLMEWTLILELQAIGLCKFCIPVVIGAVATDPALPAIANFFDGDPLSSLPDVVAEKSVNEVEQFLLSSGYAPSQQLRTRSVKETVRLLLKNMAIFTWEALSSLVPAPSLSVAPALMNSHSRELFGLHRVIADRILEVIERSAVDLPSTPSSSSPLANQTSQTLSYRATPPSNPVTPIACASVEALNSHELGVLVAQFAPKYESYISLFVDNGFDGTYLSSLRSDELQQQLQQLGISNEQHCRIIAVKLAALLPKSRPDVTASVGSHRVPTAASSDEAVYPRLPPPVVSPVSRSAIEGVFIKSKSHLFPYLTKNTRFISISSEGLKWCELSQNGGQGKEIGCVAWAAVKGVARVGLWNGLFGVKILHPDVRGNVTVLWCKSEIERGEVVAAIDSLIQRK